MSGAIACLAARRPVMTIALRASILLAICLAVAPAHAQSPSRLGEVVRKGQTVQVIDDEGREITGKVSLVSQAALHLVRDGTATEIPFARITQIARPTDSLANGALIGLAAGSAFGVVAATAGTTDCDESSEYWGPCFGGPRFIVGSALIFGGIGAGIGVGIDALVRHNRIVYRRDAKPTARFVPMVGRGRVGAVMTLGWKGE
jgi:hypothetical protein